jgi:hypothetical protein
LFRGGCPACGYSALPPGKKNIPVSKEKTAAGPLPLWVYLVTILGLIVVLFALFFTV